MVNLHLAVEDDCSVMAGGRSSGNQHASRCGPAHLDPYFLSVDLGAVTARDIHDVSRFDTTPVYGCKRIPGGCPRRAVAARGGGVVDEVRRR